MDREKASGRGGASVLVVDDESEVCEMIAAYLAPDYECLPVNSAEAALEALAARPFDLMIADIQLPEISGLDLIRIANRDHPHMVSIPISGDVSYKDEVAAIGFGAFDFIAKPFRRAALRDVVERALIYRRARQLSYEA